MAVGRAVEVEAFAVVRDFERNPLILDPQAKTGVRGLRVLADVLQRLEAAKVDGALQLAGLPRNLTDIELDRDRDPAGLRAQGCRQSIGRQQRRKDAPRKLAPC